MQTISLHKTTIIRPFKQFLTEIGAPVERILKQVKLPILSLDDPNHYISSLDFWAFVEKMAVIEGIHDLGFLTGNHAGVNALDPNYSKVLASTSSLYQALIKTCDAVNASTSRSDMLVYRHTQEYTHFCHQTSFDISHQNQFRMEWFALSVMIKIVQEFAGPEWQPKEVDLMSQQKPSAQIRQSLPDCQFIHAQTCGYISIETPLLSLAPYAKQNHVELELNLHLAEEPALDFIGSLKQALAAYMADGTPCIAIAAEISNTSVRSLQRELSYSKLNYNHLLAQVRFEMATQWLAEADVSVQDISHKLGYQNASHFARAFRRTAGMSPSEYRRAIP